ncbi:hypothetical protein N657DRAFT_148085 [Parathielavia appendiculata]|uniref:Uncharacterized protein n=1 Tax=Parathielavia appendiculata TaxID=2587402 RepID=A0AAN6Z0X1_9PEZI|nr:hypothetical protein N657DRAFT_148085 [Parathielavia appendiculata]
MHRIAERAGGLRRVSLCLHSLADRNKAPWLGHPWSVLPTSCHGKAWPQPWLLGPMDIWGRRLWHGLANAHFREPVLGSWQVDLGVGLPVLSTDARPDRSGCCKLVDSGKSLCDKEDCKQIGSRPSSRASLLSCLCTPQIVFLRTNLYLTSWN